jgi:hypothetical protein
VTPVVTGLTRATAFELRPHTNRVFISNIGFGGAPGNGEILTARVR